MHRIFLRLGCMLVFGSVAFAAAHPKPDITVAADGTGNFKTVQEAAASNSRTNTERMVVFIKNGTFKEKMRVDAPFVTLRGKSCKGTRIEFPQVNEAFTKQPDDLGRAVINLSEGADDFALENLIAEITDGQIGPHAFTIYGKGDRMVIVDCDVLSHGADTVSLWLGDRGRYYPANCRFTGSVDFIRPRGWCYVTNCTIYEMKATATTWHDGSKDKHMKFLMRDCKFDGANGWDLARHLADAQFYYLDCTFSKTMVDKPPFRVIYPLNGSTPSEAEINKNKKLDATNLSGKRSHFWSCHRDGGGYAWHSDNLAYAVSSPSASQINAEWTFAGKWNPENKTGPVIKEIKTAHGISSVTFSERVTVKGFLRIGLQDKSTANFVKYVSGSGSDTLLFHLPNDAQGKCKAIDLNGGAIIACEASAAIQPAELNFK